MTLSVRGRTYAKALQVVEERRVPFGVALAAAVFLAVSGAFGLEHIEIGGRLLFVFIVFAACASAGAIFDHFLSLGRWAHRPIVRAFIRCGVLVGPFAMISWAIAVGFYGPGRGPVEAGYALFNVTLASLALTAIRVMAGLHGKSAPRAQSTLQEFLPVGRRTAKLLALEAQDHYLRVHTTAGSELIKMRLSDALALMPPGTGLRTHRSWWVANDAVTEVRRGSGRATLALVNGISAPVSRRYVKALRDAGWS